MSKLISVDDGDKGNPHFYLRPQDYCYYLGLYYPGQSYHGDGMNQVVLNFKKCPTLAVSNPPEFSHKAPAISYLAQLLKKAFSEDAVSNSITFVPIPPSKCPTDPKYDDRIVKLCNEMVVGYGTPEVQDLFSTTVSRPRTHRASAPYSSSAVSDLQNNITFSPSVGYQPRPFIFLVDDVLRRGTHFAACRNILNQAYPDTQVAGLFLAKTDF